MYKTSFPKDLSNTLCLELKRKKLICPKVEVITYLFETMYFASLKTEESQPIVFHIVYLDPKNPDPKPPKRIVKDRWTYVKLDKPISVTISNFIKIAKASDPRTSSLAIYSDEKGELFIWGLIDQGNRYHDFVNYDVESGPERPGIFQASIAGIGHLVTYMGLWKVAELRTNTILRNELDVLAGGPIREKLEIGIQSYIEEVKSKTSEIYDDRPHWNSDLSSYWISSLCRLLLRVQNYKHGGAILVTPDECLSELNIKYKIDYLRLRKALETKAVATIEETFASDIIFSDYMDQDVDEMPVVLYLDESVARNELEENQSELEGVLWFISLLTRVDGLVVMNSNLEVKGFGVEIICSEKPSTVFVATNRNGTEKGLREADYNHYGTRHRSMMRYCFKISNSIGFVISQDGDIRSMTKLNDKLVIWENIKLQNHHYFAERKK